MIKHVILLLFFFTSCFASGVEREINVHYETPEFYQINGEQTVIHNENWKNEVLEKFSEQKHSLGQLISIQNWIKTSFKHRRGYGVTIGSITSEEIYNSREVCGCHDIALIFSSTARLLGYPCIFVETTSVSWSKAYAKGEISEPRGHVFTEIYLEGKWILFDPSTGFYLTDYDVHNPYILIDGYNADREGFYVLKKGKDTWAMGIYSLEDLLNLQQSSIKDIRDIRELID